MIPMSLGNILKIAYAASKVAETGGYLASGGKANQVSNIASVAGQAIGAASTLTSAASSVNASPGGAAKPGIKAETVKTGQVHEALKGESGVRETLIQGNKKDITKFTPDAPQADALKVNTGGYKQGSNLHKAWLKGLEQSGVKPGPQNQPRPGALVRTDGTPMKWKGWDILARGKALEGVEKITGNKALLAEAQGYRDRAERIRMQATEARKAVSPETPTKPTSPKMEVQSKSNKTVSTPVSKDLVIDTKKGGTPKPTPKPTTKDVDAGITKQDRERWEELKSRRDLTQEEQEEMARMAPKFMQKPQGRLYIKDFDKGWE